MYEYLLENLISDSQIESNLRRTASEGLISRLNKRQLIKLALKYFGVDEYGNYTDDTTKIVAYRCPYSGEIIDDVNDIHLDHIIPFTNNGGTILFNCIPVYNSINISKKDNQLLGWWTRQEYFTLERLERLLQYMLEAYSIAFNEYTIEELEESKSYFLNYENERFGDLKRDKREREKIYKKNVPFSNVSYQQLITNIILYLKDNNVDCTRYEVKLHELEKKNVFLDVKKYELVEREIQKMFKKICGDNNLYITYSLNVNINKLLNTFVTNDIVSEVQQRFTHIFKLLEENNISLIDYMKNLVSIDENINPLYYSINDINNNMIHKFIENVRIGKDSKILMFINMLKFTNTENIASIIKSNTHERFKIYKKDNNGNYVVDKEFGSIGQFWNDHKNEILSIIYNNDKYVELRSKLDYYYMMTRGGKKTSEGYKRKIDIFINMLKIMSFKDFSIMIQGSQETFKTYKKDNNGNYVIDKEYGLINQFWHDHESEISSIIYNNDKYVELRDKLDYYYMMIKNDEGKRRRKEIFINMLRVFSIEKIDLIMKSNSKERFKTYKRTKDGDLLVDKEFGLIGSYWQRHKNEILPIIYQSDRYIAIRDKLDYYYMMTKSGQLTDEGISRRKEIFINMLRLINIEDVNDFLKSGTTRTFKTYKKNNNGNYVIDKEYGIIGDYWTYNKEDIISTIYNDDRYIEIINKLDYYYMMTKGGQMSDEGNNRRKEIFINMLNVLSINEIESITKAKSNETFKTYKKDNNGNYVIDKEYGIIGEFWIKNRDDILSTIYNDDKYVEIRYKLDEYYMMTRGGQISKEGQKRKVEILINMLNIESIEKVGLIMKSFSNETFKTYKKDNNGNYVIDKEYGIIDQFFRNSKDKLLIPMLFFDKKYFSKEFDKARANIMNYLNLIRKNRGQSEFKNINEYLETLDKSKKEVKELIILRDKLLREREDLVKENGELNEQIDSISQRRAM